MVSEAKDVLAPNQVYNLARIAAPHSVTPSTKLEKQ
jgi:hypothetical protein